MRSWGNISGALLSLLLFDSEYTDCWTRGEFLFVKSLGTELTLLPNLLSLVADHTIMPSVVTDNTTQQPPRSSIKLEHRPDVIFCFI
jgi:hypothetical protein